MDHTTETRRAIEAICMVTDQPVEPSVLAQLLEIPKKQVEAICEELAAEYEAENRGFMLARVAGGYRYQTDPDTAPYVERFVLEGQSSRLSAAALETLAIVAYKQPISRLQIAAIRGVNVDGVMRTLQQRGYVDESGRDPGPGNAVLFATTPLFLERVGLDSVDDLPPLAEFVPGADVVEALEEGLRPHELDPNMVLADDADAETPTDPDSDSVPDGETEIIEDNGSADAPDSPEAIDTLVGATEASESTDIAPVEDFAPIPSPETPAAEPDFVALATVDLGAPPEAAAPSHDHEAPEPVVDLADGTTIVNNNNNESNDDIAVDLTDADADADVADKDDAGDAGDEGEDGDGTVDIDLTGAQAVGVTSGEPDDAVAAGGPNPVLDGAPRPKAEPIIEVTRPVHRSQFVAASPPEPPDQREQPPFRPALGHHGAEETETMAADDMGTRETGSEAGGSADPYGAAAPDLEA